VTVSRPVRAEAASIALSTRLSPAERDRVDQAAKANHQTRSEFARDALVTAANECLEDPTAAHS
jgi:uncharacterized protein (DUF1778 family)